MLRVFLSRLFLTALFVMMLPSSLRAQQSSGALNGIVTDSTGASVPNAVLSLTNIETSIVRTVETKGSGVYVFSNVLPGTYSLSVHKDGFGGIKQSGIVLGVNQTLTYNFPLKVSAQKAQITVRAAGAQLEASTTELGSVIANREVTTLPLNGREFTQLLMLTPGASHANTSQNKSGIFSPSTGPIYFPAMHGQSNRSNYFMLDGINDTEVVFGTFAVSPTVDDIQEFKVQSHNDAQFGGVTGGIINVVTKSGTNHPHGAVWEFNRNAIFGAANPITRIKLPLNQNQFGGNLGGPVILPHLYSGRSKTFFFFSYEGFRRQTTSGSSFTRVPTAAQLAGDFSSISHQLYNPFTTHLNGSGQYVRDPYPGNQIDPSTFNPLMLAYATLLLPQPNASNLAGNYVNNTPQTQDQNNFSGRLDETINPSNSMWFRYSTGDQNSISSTYPILTTTAETKTNNYGINFLHIFNNSTTLDVQFGHNLISNLTNGRYTIGSSSSILQKVPFSQSFACGYKAFGAPSDCLIPTVGITGYAGGGELSQNNDPATSLY